MNTILGGSFTSRLNQNLREKNQYTYGAFSAFDFRPSTGPFVASAAVQTNVTDKALVEFTREIRGITDSVTSVEIARAKNYVALQFPAEFQSVENIARQLADVVTYGLADNYLNNYIGQVMGVTKADVERVAKKYIDPERIAIIVVGDRSQVEQGIRNLKLGELRLVYGRHRGFAHANFFPLAPASCLTVATNSPSSFPAMSFSVIPFVTS